MTRKPRPVLLTVVAAFVILGIDVAELALSGWMSQVVPFAIRHSIIWMSGCFVAMRYGATDWSTRVVPIGLCFWLVLSHCAATSLSDYGIGGMASMAVAEITSFVLTLSTTIVFSRLLDVSLRQVNCTAQLAPLRCTIQTIFLVTTSMAVFIALQRWIGTIESRLIVSESAHLMGYVLQVTCIASAFFGTIWAMISTRLRWLGLLGLMILPISPITMLYLVLSPETQKLIPGLSPSALMTALIINFLAIFIGALVAIPILRLFGYQFRIGNQDLMTSSQVVDFVR